MSETPQLLSDLLGAPGPSGYEGPANDVWRDAASFADVSTSDALGSSVARIGDADAKPLFAIVGHIDEIGLVVTHVDEKGFLYFAPIGGWDPQILLGQRVRVQTKDGPVSGVIGRKPIHLLRDEQRKKVAELRDMHIDIGAADGDEALERVRIGDSAVIAADPVRSRGGSWPPAAWTTGSGSTWPSRRLVRCTRAAGSRAGMAAVAAVQEEIGSKGALTTAFSLQPDLAIAVDVTHATDAPGIEEKELGRHHLGSGPVIGRGATLSPHIFEMLAETAERNEASRTRSRRRDRATHTDADAIQIARAGHPRRARLDPPALHALPGRGRRPGRRRGDDRAARGLREHARARPRPHPLVPVDPDVGLGELDEVLAGEAKRRRGDDAVGRRPERHPGEDDEDLPEEGLVSPIDQGADRQRHEEEHDPDPALARAEAAPDPVAPGVDGHRLHVVMDGGRDRLLEALTSLRGREAERDGWRLGRVLAGPRPCLEDPLARLVAQRPPLHRLGAPRVEQGLDRRHPDRKLRHQDR